MLMKCINSGISVIWRRKLGKLQYYIEKVDFWPALHEICSCHGNIKNDRHTIDISKFPQKMNEQLLKVSAS